MEFDESALELLAYVAVLAWSAVALFLGVRRQKSYIPAWYFSRSDHPLLWLLSIGFKATLFLWALTGLGRIVLSAVA